MPLDRDSPSPSKPRPVPGSSPEDPRSRSPLSSSASRAASTARLASPVPSSVGVGVGTPRQTPFPNQTSNGTQSPLAGATSSSIGPGRSALAAALESNYGRSPPRFGTPPIRPLSPATGGPAISSSEAGRYGSYDARSIQNGSGPPKNGTNEDPEVVKRHLVRPSNEDLLRARTSSSSVKSNIRRGSGRRVELPDAPDLEEFSSLQLQGGDVTRQVYRWAESAEGRSMSGGRGKRSKSFTVDRPEPGNEVLDINSIKAPGGFRRNYIRRSGGSPARRTGYGPPAVRDEERGGHPSGQPRIFTSNFIEFLTLYGHFAGEELEDEDMESNDYFSSRVYDGDAEEEGDGGEEPGEGSALLTPKTPGGRRRATRPRTTQGETTAFGAALLLLKSFVGTGVLFLPRAYLNGGMMFANLVLLATAALSYYCFILLVNTHLKVHASFGDMGGILYGKVMRNIILASIVLSQMGFVAAYIVFTSENLQAFVLAVSKCATWIDIKYMVLMQMIIFLPLSLVRDIGKLGITALVADAFILLGLLYLYYFDVATLVANHGVADIVQFNPNDWTLFIGTAIFTFEGIGLIIPIQESMKKPSKFPPVLAIVMVIITVIFISMGAISYAAYGSATKTVVLLNLPQDSKFVNAVQFLYSLAILLSTPLQLFPAIRILENEIFTRSGKHNPYIKWRKNVFRFLIVVICAAIAWGGAGDLDKFVALVGSFACIPLVYIYPVSLSSSRTPKAVSSSYLQLTSEILANAPL